VDHREHPWPPVYRAATLPGNLAVDRRDRV